MHPQLSDKRIGQYCSICSISLFLMSSLVCKEFIKALEECHSNTWRKFTGACNKQKDELNHCLRTEVKSYESAAVLT